MTLPRAALRLALRVALCALCLGLALGAQHARPLAALAPEGLDQILGDGQPEDIGYGFQRARTISRNIRSSRKDTSPKTPPQFVLSNLNKADPGNDPAITKSMFRERMVRQRRQRQQPQQQLQQQQWSDWRRETPSISSFYPPIGPNDPIENPERYMEALREAWVRYQQQTGAIDVGPDDLTDLETLQFLEALGAGEEIPGSRKRSVPSSGQYALYNAPSDWAAPLAWNGYPLRKRAANSEFQDDSGEWVDDGGDDDSGPMVPGSRLAALLSQQLFDERYDDPAVKRLLLAKRSTQPQQQQQQHKVQAKSSPAGEEAAADGLQGLQGLQGRAMRRRKKSTRPALASAQQGLAQQGMSMTHAMSQHEASMHKDLARIFGEPEQDGEPEPPLALPLMAGEVEPPLALPLTAGHGLVKRTAVAAADTTAAPAAVAPIASAGGSAVAATTAPAGKSATTTTPVSKNDVSTAVVVANPIGHAHETDKIAREHHQQHGAHAPSTAPPANVQVTIHAEHAPPMVSAEGPHGHDHAVHAEDKEVGKSADVKDGSPAGAAGGARKMSLLEAEEPLSMGAARHPRPLAKKSIDWSQYFGLDRRRKKSLSINDVDAPARIDPDWMMRHNLVGFRLLLPSNSKPSNINKRVAIKREGASPDSLLFGSWGRQGLGQGGWDDAEDGASDDDGEDDDDENGGDALGRCPAVMRLAESCRLAVGPSDGLLPICVLYQACHLCGAAMGVPVGSSCEAELSRRGAEMCASTSSPGGARRECHGRVAAIVDLYRASSGRQPDTETCAKQPCLAHFFLTAPAVAFSR